MPLKQMKTEGSEIKRQVSVETWRRYKTGYVQLLWKASAPNATGKIQESLRRENYVCRAVGENVPSTESGTVVGIVAQWRQARVWNWES